MSLRISNVHLPLSDKSTLWDITCNDGVVSNVSPADLSNPGTLRTLNGNGGLLLPSLCHSHVHLDKCFILDRSDLVHGDFKEALFVTGKAKAGFPKDTEDLYQRGERVIKESIEAGVTSLRAHVEVDSIVGFASLDMALALRAAYRTLCDVQIAVFAQEPLFTDPSSTTPGPNYSLLSQALSNPQVHTIGSAPYVEPTSAQSKFNISLILDLASTYSKHIDFHLDYNLDLNAEPLIHTVITEYKHRYLDKSLSTSLERVHLPRLTVGHATRLQLFTPSEWTFLSESAHEVPLSLVSLPQSDLYMQGRASSSEPLGAPRGTLRVPLIAKSYGIEVAMSVNNVGNAFTPQGSMDPLSLCVLGAAVFQSGTNEDARMLAKSVTLTSKTAIAEEKVPKDLIPSVGDSANFVILHGRSSLQSAVFNPPYDQTTIYAGNVVACRRSKSALLTTNTHKELLLRANAL